jgi:hypothetical protein
MPDVFVYTSKKRATKLAELLGPNGNLAYALRTATADAFGDVPASHVEIRLIGCDAEDNTTLVQILCLASATPERAGKEDGIIARWAYMIAQAWANVGIQLPELLTEICPLQEVGIWPIMPKGNWFLASDLLKR